MRIQKVTNLTASAARHHFQASTEQMDTQA